MNQPGSRKESLEENKQVGKVRVKLADRLFGDNDLGAQARGCVAKFYWIKGCLYSGYNYPASA